MTDENDPFWSNLCFCPYGHLLEGDFSLPLFVDIVVFENVYNAMNFDFIVRGSSSFVINADSCIVKVQGFIYFTLTCRISPPHLTSSGTVFFLTPQLLLRRRSARCARLPPAQSLCHVYYDEFFGSPQKNFANERGFDFLDGRKDRRTDGQTDRRTDGRTDGQTDRNFVEILGKLCFARLKLNLKTEDRFKLKTKLGHTGVGP